MARSERKHDKNRQKEMRLASDDIAFEPPKQSSSLIVDRDPKSTRDQNMTAASTDAKLGGASESFDHLKILDDESDRDKKPSVQESKIPPSLPPLCRFFVIHGSCRYRRDCRFSHSLPAGGLLEARKHTPCPFYRQGNCRYGEHCQLRHDANDLVSVTCGICLEVMTAKNFGLLSGCDHVFCFGCLKQWRATKSSMMEDMDTRTCPTCRQTSDFIVPCERFCTGDDKKQVIADYKAHLATRPCKRFNGRFGSCPFGRECFYAHIGDNGNDCKALDKPRRERHQRNHCQHEVIEMHGFAMLLGLLAEMADGQSDEDENDIHLYMHSRYPWEM